MKHVTTSIPQNISEKELSSLLRQFAIAINMLISSIEQESTGKQKPSGSGHIRAVKDRDGYYMELKFADGWFRLPTSFEPVDKR